MSTFYGDTVINLLKSHDLEMFRYETDTLEINFISSSALLEGDLKLEGYGHKLVLLGAANYKDNHYIILQDPNTDYSNKKARSIGIPMSLFLRFKPRVYQIRKGICDE